jgi:hypothetical protein
MQAAGQEVPSGVIDDQESSSDVRYCSVFALGAFQMFTFFRFPFLFSCFQRMRRMMMQMRIQMTKR